MEDRSWAVDLTQEEFNLEFPRRFPSMDVIPDLGLWTKNVPPAEDRNIQPFNTELMVPENPIPMSANDEPRPVEKDGYVKFSDGTWGCTCGYKSKVKVAVYNHHKKCETFLKGKHG